MKSIIKLIRAYQWTKSGFIFLPFIFSDLLIQVARDLTGELTQSVVIALALAFTAFSFMASAVYVMNDIKDVELDRNDPRKMHRPLASGKISVPSAIFILILLLSVSLIIAWLLSFSVFMTLVFYFLLNVFYTLIGKQIILVDVFIISTGYVLRVMVGALAIRVDASPWLLASTFFIALFLGFFKRFYEVSTSPAEKMIGGVYHAETLKQFTGITAALSVVTYTIYSISGPHAGANLVWTVPLVVLGIFRFFVLMQFPDEIKDGNPSDLLLADKFLIAIIVSWLALCGYLLLAFA